MSLSNLPPPPPPSIPLQFAPPLANLPNVSPPQDPPPNGSLSAATATSTNNTGTSNTPPVVKQKIPKSEFKRLTNEWKETHEKLSDNFRELTVIFAEIKFLLQKLESQLAAAGIKSEVSNCFEEVQSCLESFSNANAHAAALDIHLKQLDENVFDKAPQDAQGTLKMLREQITKAGNIGKTTGIFGATQNASGTQAAQPTAQTGTVTQSNSPAEQVSSVIQGCKNSLTDIGRNVSRIENDINSTNQKIKGLKTSPAVIGDRSNKIRADLEKVYKNWEIKKDLFDQEKKKKDTAIRLGASQTLTDQQNYELKLDELRNQSSIACRELIDMLVKLEKIENKTQSMSVDLKQLGDDKNKINALVESAQTSSFDAHLDLNDSLQNISQSNLGKKGKKEINELITAFNEKDNKLENNEAELKLIEEELTELNKFLAKISVKNWESKSACEMMISEIQAELNGLIWM